jgi:Chromo (CHRromatin Organisation MOdifier) domain/Ubiquitin family
LQNDIPSCIDNSFLFCPHGNIIYDLEKDSKQWNELAEPIMPEDWEYLTSAYELRGDSAEFVKSKVDEETVVTSRPNVCDECRIERLMDYKEATIIITKRADASLTTSASLLDNVDVPTESFEVDKIVGHRKEDGVMKFKVRWKRFTESDDTWEPHASFDDEASILNYMKEYPLEFKKQLASINDGKLKESVKHQEEDDEVMAMEDDIVEVKVVKRSTARSPKEIIEIGCDPMEIDIPSEPAVVTVRSRRKAKAANDPMQLDLPIESAAVGVRSKRKPKAEVVGGNDADYAEQDKAKKRRKKGAETTSKSIEAVASSPNSKPRRKGRTYNYPIVITPETTVKDLSLKVYESCFIPPLYQKLIFNEKPLDDPSATMKELQIYEGVTVHLEVFDESTGRFDFSSEYQINSGLPPSKELGFSNTNLLGRRETADDISEPIDLTCIRVLTQRRRRSLSRFTHRHYLLEPELWKKKETLSSGSAIAVHLKTKTTTPLAMSAILLK